MPRRLKNVALILATVFIIGCQDSSQTDGSIIFGELREDTVSPQTVPVALIQAGNQKVKADRKGRYTIVGLERGKIELVVSSPGHEIYRKKVEISTGDNEADVALLLTPSETVKRYLLAQKEARFDEAYEYLHPEIKSNVSKNDYINYFQEASKKLQLVAFKVERARLLKTWAHKGSGRIFKNVAEMRTSLLLTTSSGKKMKATATTHLVKVYGQWKGFWTMPKKQ